MKDKDYQASCCGVLFVVLILLLDKSFLVQLYQTVPNPFLSAINAQTNRQKVVLIIVHKVLESEAQFLFV